MRISDQFNQNWILDEKTGCWNWQRSKTPRGYGKLVVNGRLVAAHRFSWQISKSIIPDNLSVLHSCDNRGCVNPDHLFLGTQDDNMKDMARKGRRLGRGPRGESHHLGKLIQGDVDRIRDLIKCGTMQREISKYFNVSQHAIHCIAAGKSWK